MKTKPDDNTITRWIDGELESEELLYVENWAKDHPELLAERDAVRALSASMREHVAASEEPPYPDFFNQKILQSIASERVEKKAKGSGFWQWLSAPLAIPLAFAAMAICFYLGTQVKTSPEGAITQSTAVSAPVASVYTPDGNVKADVFKASKVDATVIVLEGLDDLPDDFEVAFSEEANTEDSVFISTRDDQLIF